MRGLLIGLTQGILCPTSLMGVGFAGKFSTVRPSVFQIVWFLVGVTFFTIFFSVTIVMAILILISCCSSTSSTSIRPIYISSCILTIALGVAWIVLSHTGHINLLEGGGHVAHKLGQF